MAEDGGPAGVAATPPTGAGVGTGAGGVRATTGCLLSCMSHTLTLPSSAPEAMYSPGRGDEERAKGWGHGQGNVGVRGEWESAGGMGECGGNEGVRGERESAGGAEEWGGEQGSVRLQEAWDEGQGRLADILALLQS